MFARIKQWLRYGAVLIPAAPIAYFEWDRIEQYLRGHLRAGWSESPPAKSEGDASETTILPGTPLAAVPPRHGKVRAKPAALEPSLDHRLKERHPPPVTIEEAFSFQVTVPWILGRWPRVSTQLSLLELQGYRVPLVTGTAMDDLAGSLTYYFNPRQELQRITFTGTTGDTRRLVNLLERRFSFQRHSPTNPNLHLYQVLWNGEPRGQLWIQPVAVVDKDRPHERFSITLAIDRPNPFSASRGK